MTTIKIQKYLVVIISISLSRTTNLLQENNKTSITYQICIWVIQQHKDSLFCIKPWWALLASTLCLNHSSLVSNVVQCFESIERTYKKQSTNVIVCLIVTQCLLLFPNGFVRFWTLPLFSVLSWHWSSANTFVICGSFCQKGWKPYAGG